MGGGFDGRIFLRGVIWYEGITNVYCIREMKTKGGLVPVSPNWFGLFESDSCKLSPEASFLLARSRITGYIHRAIQNSYVKGYTSTEWCSLSRNDAITLISKVTFNETKSESRYYIEPGGTVITRTFDNKIGVVTIDSVNVFESMFWHVATQKYICNSREWLHFEHISIRGAWRWRD